MYSLFCSCVEIKRTLKLAYAVTRSMRCERIAANPHLPTVSAKLNWEHTRAHRQECGPSFYYACLELAQAYWLQGKQAQAILQMNKSFLADVPEPQYPLPYAALGWLLEHRREQEFLGNPVRHFQHLATRMTPPRKQLRTWRAWACFYISKKVLPADDYPLDTAQIKKEKLLIPEIEQVLDALDALGVSGEYASFASLVNTA